VTYADKLHRQKERYWKLKRAGVCVTVTCGNSVADDNLAHCVACREHLRIERKKQKQAAKDRLKTRSDVGRRNENRSS
jgi:hypothetical protein